jgi:hypothetical protein
MFSHTSNIISSTVIFIISTPSIVNDVSIGIMWPFSFFLVPLASSLGLFLWSYDGLDTYEICVSIVVSFPTSSMATSYSSICTSFVLTYPISPLGDFSLHGGPYVGLHCDLFFLLIFFQIKILSPTVPIVVFFFLASVIPTYLLCGIVLPCV